MGKESQVHLQSRKSSRNRKKTKKLLQLSNMETLLSQKTQKRQRSKKKSSKLRFKTESQPLVQPNDTKQKVLSLNKGSLNQQMEEKGQKDHKISALSAALAQAIDQNQILRKRVIELECLLVVSQMQKQKVQQKLKLLQRDKQSEEEQKSQNQNPITPCKKKKSENQDFSQNIQDNSQQGKDLSNKPSHE